MLNRPLCQPLLRCHILQPLQHLGSPPPLDLLQDVSIFFPNSADTLVQMLFYQCPKGGEGSFPWTYPLHWCYHHPGCCWPPLQEGAAKSMGDLWPSRTLRSLPAKLLSPALPQPILVHEMHSNMHRGNFKCLYWTPWGSRQATFPADSSSAQQPHPQAYWLLPQHATSWDLLCLHSVPSSRPSVKGPIKQKLHAKQPETGVKT